MKTVARLTDLSPHDAVDDFPPALTFLPRPRFNVGAPICFVHVMKTAGTTVRLTIENAFDGARVFPSGSAAYSGGYLKLGEALEAGDRFENFAAISGHYGWRIAPHLPPNANLFTWFREPRDRAYSYFFFKVVQNRATGSSLFLNRIDNGERLESVFMDWARKTFKHPFYALAVGNQEGWLEANPHTRLQDVAVDVLRRCFFIGLLEDHERSLDGLCALTSILPPKQAVKRNVGVKRGSGLSLTAEEQAQLDDILAPDLALYERVLEVYKLQMDSLKANAGENPALDLIGDREALRQHLLRRPEAIQQRKLTRWNAWDAIQGENLDSREEHKEEDGSVGRWRWTASMPDTYLYFEPPRRAFRVRIRLNPATPIENARSAQLKIAGHEISLKLENADSGRHDLVGDVSKKIARRLPEVVEFHIHTPVMLDESQFGYVVGTRMLGLALEAISAESIPKRPLHRRIIGRIRRTISGFGNRSDGLAR